MPFEKGHKKAIGRPKGSINKRTLPLREKAEALGIDPFTILLYFCEGNYKALGYSSAADIQPAIRSRAAAEACQYLYPKLKQIEQVRENNWEFLPTQQKLEAAKQLVSVLEKEVNGNGN